MSRVVGNSSKHLKKVVLDNAVIVETKTTMEGNNN